MSDLTDNTDIRTFESNATVSCSILNNGTATIKLPATLANAYLNFNFLLAGEYVTEDISGSLLVEAKYEESPTITIATLDLSNTNSYAVEGKFTDLIFSLSGLINADTVIIYADQNSNLSIDDIESTVNSLNGLVGEVTLTASSPLSIEENVGLNSLNFKINSVSSLITYVDNANGDNTTGQPNNQFLPYKTINAGLQNMSTNGGMLAINPIDPTGSPTRYPNCTTADLSLSNCTIYQVGGAKNSESMSAINTFSITDGATGNIEYLTFNDLSCRALNLTSQNGNIQSISFNNCVFDLQTIIDTTGSSGFPSSSTIEFNGGYFGASILLFPTGYAIQSTMNITFRGVKFNTGTTLTQNANILLSFYDCINVPDIVYANSGSSSRTIIDIVPEIITTDYNLSSADYGAQLAVDTDTVNTITIDNTKVSPGFNCILLGKNGTGSVDIVDKTATVLKTFTVGDTIEVNVVSSASPNPIVCTGLNTVDNTTTGTFGAADTVPQIDVDSNGNITNVVDVPIQISESQVTDLVTDLSNLAAGQTNAAILGQLLTNLMAGSNTPILATDDILSAFENLQAQLTALGIQLSALLAQGVIYIGGWDASGGTYPTVGSGTSGEVEAGNVYSISVAGTLGGEYAPQGSILLAEVLNPGQTPSNWSLNTTGVVTFNGRAGIVVPLANDYDFSMIAGTAAIGQGGTGLTSVGASGTLLSSNGTGMVFTTATYPITSGTSGTVLRSNGTNIVNSTSTYADTYALNSILYASSANAVSGLATANSSVLTTDGSGNLAWSTALAATLGGTGQLSYTIGDILYASSSTALSKLSAVATGNALISGGVGAPSSWGKIDLTTTVSGILPIANGGTGNTSGQAASVANSLTMNNSGSGDASGDTYNGSAAKTISYNTIGASPLAGSSSLVTTGTITSGIWNGTKIAEAYGGTNQSTYTTGDILYASASNTLSKLGIGISSSMLQVISGVPSWSNIQYPTSITQNRIPFASSNNVLSAINPTSRGILCWDSFGTPTSTGALGNGQIPIGSASGTPTAATLTAGTGVSITNGANSITIGLSPSYGTIWMNSGNWTGTSTLGFTTSYQELTGLSTSFTLATLESDFAMSTDGQLKYTGATTKTFLVSAYMAVNNGGSFAIQIYKNGSGVSGSESYAVGAQSVVITQFPVSLAQNDYVSLWTKRSAGGVSPAITQISLSARSV